MASFPSIMASSFGVCLLFWCVSLMFACRPNLPVSLLFGYDLPNSRLPTKLYFHSIWNNLKFCHNLKRSTFLPRVHVKWQTNWLPVTLGNYQPMLWGFHPNGSPHSWPCMICSLKQPIFHIQIVSLFKQSVPILLIWCLVNLSCRSSQLLQLLLLRNVQSNSMAGFPILSLQIT